MFGNTSSSFRPGSLFGNTNTSTISMPSIGPAQSQAHNPNKDYEVSSPPDDSIQVIRFSPPAVPQNFIASGSWDNLVRIWEVKQDGSSEPKAQQTAGGPVLDLSWADDGSKVYFSSADRQAKMWDLAGNACTQVAAHDAPIKTCHWIKTDKYSCLMTGGWDKQLRFWDTRSPNPILSFQLPERVYCADVDLNMAVVCTADRMIYVYNLTDQPTQVSRVESPLKYQHRCVAVFRDKDLKGPVGFAVGSIEGRVAIQYVNAVNPKDNFTFKCHRSAEVNNGFQDIFAVNCIAFHPQHGTLATVGSDGRFSFWDKDGRTKLKTSERCELPITSCCINKSGDIFAYSVSYDWSKGHEANNPQQKNYIFLRSCTEEMKPRPKK